MEYFLKTTAASLKVREKLSHLFHNNNNLLSAGWNEKSVHISYSARLI